MSRTPFEDHVYEKVTPRNNVKYSTVQKSEPHYLPLKSNEYETISEVIYSKITTTKYERPNKSQTTETTVNEYACIPGLKRRNGIRSK